MQLHTHSKLLILKKIMRRLTVDQRVWASVQYLMPIMQEKLKDDGI